MRDLTKAEEEIMQVLWKLESAFVKEIIRELPEPKPAYNTVSTIVRILEQKEMVSYKSFGKSHQYYPLISKENYSEHKTKGLLKGYFSGSISKFVSSFVDGNDIGTEELDDILKLIEQKKQKKS